LWLEVYELNHSITHDGNSRGRDHKIVGFTTIYAIGAYQY